MTYGVQRDENAQKEWAITVATEEGPKLAIPGVRFETEREARLAMDALAAAPAGDGPHEFAAPFKFRNWAKPGLVIQGEKAIQVATNFREIARAVRQSPAERAADYAAYLDNLAGQYEAAAQGQGPKAP